MRPLPNGLVEVDTETGPLALPPYLAERYASEMPAMPAPPTLAEAGATAATDWSNSAPPPGLMAPPPEAPPQMPDWAKPGAVAKMTGAPVTAKTDPSAIQPPAPPAQAGATEQPRSYAQRLAQATLDAGPQSHYVASRAAGYVPGQRTQRMTAPESPEAIEKQQEANEWAHHADVSQSLAVAAQSDAARQVAEAQAAQAQSAAESEKARLAEQARRLGELRERRDTKRAEVAAQTIDPNRWDRSGGVGRVLAAISIGLSGVGQALGAGDNGMTALLQGIQRDDVEAQKFEFNRAAEAGEEVSNDYADALAMYGDPILAERQAELLANEAIIKQIQARQQASAGEADKAGAVAMVAERAAERQRLLDAMDGRAQEIVVTEDYDRGQAGGVVTEGTDKWLERAVKLAETGAKLDKLTADPKADPYAGLTDSAKADAIARQVNVPGIGIRWAKDKEDATKAANVLRSADKYTENLREMRKIVELGIAGKMDARQRGRLKSLAAQNVFIIKNTEGLGAITESDAVLADPFSGKDVAEFTSFDESILGSFDESERYVRGQKETVLSNLYTDFSGSNPVAQDTTSGAYQGAGVTPF